MSEELLIAKGISKSFAGNKVLDNVSFSVKAAQVHALVGENGAGKSTLMNIIGGIHQADEGELFVGGQRVHFSDPLEAINAGISTVHQELSLAPNLTVSQNIFSHREQSNWFGFIKWQVLFEKTRSLFEQIGIDIDPSTLVGDLAIGMQQTVEIAKALSLNARVIVMDEPTSALSEKEIEHLYKIINDLKSQGVAIIFISHKLNEVFRISDEISVLRDGLMIGTVKTAESNSKEIIKMMVGRHITDLYPAKSTYVKEEFFSVEALTCKGRFEDISFSLRKGEILGFAGLVGSGRTEVARAIFGADRFDSGRVLLDGREIKIRSPLSAINQGLCYLTEDRKSLGLFLTMSVRENIVSAALKSFVSRLFFLRRKEIKKKSMEFVNYMEIRPFNDEVSIISLSGGNQQKTLLAKWLCSQPKVLIVDEPTRGVDIGAKAKIHNDLRKLAEKGIGVIVISSELPEVLGLSDRIAVFHEGRIAALFQGCVTQEEVMKYATG
jgi:ribose transport system ATP-binding protein